MQLENRQNPKVFEAFSTVLQSPRLFADHDRLGMMRPTIGININGYVHPTTVPSFMCCCVRSTNMWCFVTLTLFSLSLSLSVCVCVLKKKKREVREMAEWRTRANWLHLDCNPSAGYASIGGFKDNFEPIDFDKSIIIQALITLSDARIEDGGFHCVPGTMLCSVVCVFVFVCVVLCGQLVFFPLLVKQTKKNQRKKCLPRNNVCVCVWMWMGGGHTASHEITQEWAHAHQETGTSRNLQVESKHCDQCKALHTRIQKIPIPQGCLLVWSSLLMHGNHPNHSTQWRCCQYIRAMPVVGTPYSPLCPEQFYYPDTFVPTELGEKLFGLKPWEKEEGREL